MVIQILKSKVTLFLLVIAIILITYYQGRIKKKKQERKQKRENKRGNRAPGCRKRNQRPYWRGGMPARLAR